MSAVMIYVTCASHPEAETIAGRLVTQKLIACANIFQPHLAVFEWEGSVESEEEVAMILKTRDDLFEQVRQAVLDAHSYDCPCIVALPISQGHQPFLDWIGEEASS